MPMRERSLLYKHLLMLGALALSTPVAAETATTRHSITLHGQALSYQATAATLPIRTTDGAQAEMFHVDYIRPDAPATSRPVIFLFNGGPGSASLWLGIGSFAPRRVETNSPAATPAWPIRMVDNQETLLDVADLVFVDAVGTGYSRVSSGTAANAFDGVDPDLASFTAFISTWLTQNNRWASPRFVLGKAMARRGRRRWPTGCSMRARHPRG
jgi:carboxypeptidase C (cathepsin A)